MTISAYGCRNCTPNWKNSARMYGYCAMPTGCCPKMTTCWIIRTCACCSKLVSRLCNATGLSVRCRTSQSAEKCTTRLPMSGSSSRNGSALPRYASSRKNTARRKRSELKSRGGSTPASLLFYGLPNLSAFFLSCSACSFNSLARYNASACFLLRYSKPFTESVRLRMKALSRSLLNFVSSKSRLLPSAFPFIRI